MVVFPLPASMKVAVSPVSGTGLADQLPSVAQLVSVLPVHVALTASASGLASVFSAMQVSVAERNEEYKKRVLGFMD